MDLELHENNECVVLDERKSVVPNFRFVGQLVTSDVRLNPQNQYVLEDENLMDVNKSTKTTKSCQNGLKYSELPLVDI